MKKKASKKPVSKAKKSPRKKTVVIPIHVDQATINFYTELGRLCGISKEKACLVLIMAESLRLTKPELKGLLPATEFYP